MLSRALVEPTLVEKVMFVLSLWGWNVMCSNAFRSNSCRDGEIGRRTRLKISRGLNYPVPVRVRLPAPLHCASHFSIFSISQYVRNICSYYGAGSPVCCFSEPSGLTFSASNQRLVCCLGELSLAGAPFVLWCRVPRSVVLVRPSPHRLTPILAF